MTRGMLRRMERAGAVAFLAHDEQQPETRVHRFSSSSSAAVIMAAMMPLVSHAPRPQMNSASSRRRDKRRYGVHVRRQSDNGRVAKPGKDVEATRLHVHPFGHPAVARG